MARIKRSNDMVSVGFLSAVKKAARELLPDTTDFTTCASTSKIAQHKAVKNYFTVTNNTHLKILVRTSIPQLHGFASKRGQSCGVHRVKVTRNRTAKPVVENIAPTANDTQAPTAEVANG